VQLVNGASIQTTSGAITIDGTGGTGGLGVAHRGIGLADSNIGTQGGDITLTGQGGTTLGTNGTEEGSHHGIFIAGPSSITDDRRRQDHADRNGRNVVDHRRRIKRRWKLRRSAYRERRSAARPNGKRGHRH
jgi:hypothetical protein